MSPFTAFEKRVLEACLAGEHPTLRTLRLQADAATVSSRESTGPGAYVNFSVPESAPLLEAGTIIIGDVNVTVRDVPAGLATLLYIYDGKLQFLELATYDGDWPEDPEIISVGYLQEVEVGANSFNLVPVAERHLETLDRALERTVTQGAA